MHKTEEVASFFWDSGPKSLKIIWEGERVRHWKRRREEDPQPSIKPGDHIEGIDLVSILEEGARELNRQEE